MSALRTTAIGASGAVGLAAVIALAGPMVSKWEGRRLDPYLDIANVWTVCDGETAVRMRRYTPAECDAMLAASLRKHAGPILECLPPAAPLEVKAAFASFGYNVGVSAACSSTAARKARAYDFRGACDGLLAWNKARVNGELRFVQGLANRRADERALCLKGLA